MYSHRYLYETYIAKIVKWKLQVTEHAKKEIKRIERTSITVIHFTQPLIQLSPTIYIGLSSK